MWAIYVHCLSVFYSVIQCTLLYCRCPINNTLKYTACPSLKYSVKDQELYVGKVGSSASLTSLGWSYTMLFCQKFVDALSGCSCVLIMLPSTQLEQLLFCLIAMVIIKTDWYNWEGLCYLLDKRQAYLIVQANRLGLFSLSGPWWMWNTTQ